MPNVYKQGLGDPILLLADVTICKLLRCSLCKTLTTLTLMKTDERVRSHKVGKREMRGQVPSDIMAVSSLACFMETSDQETCSMSFTDRAHALRARPKACFKSKTKPQHRVSWCHPRSKHWHQLDLILIRRSNIKLVQITRTYHSADCDTDHSLVCCKIRLQPKKLHKSKQKGKPRMNTMGMHLPEKVEEFAKSLQKALSVEHQHCSAAEKWNHLRDTIQKTALATFGKKTSKNNDWFDAKFSEMSPVIDSKRAALAEYKRSPSEKTLQALRAVRSKVQQTARRCANEYWQHLSDSIQFAAVSGNIRGMYEGIKTALGPPQSKTAPLKTTSGEVITDKGKQMDRWVEHYSELYSRENTVAPSALDAIEPLAIMEELDAEPTIAELCKAIDSLASGKAPGNDGIPPDLIKCCKNTLLQPLHDVLCQCWKEGVVPQDMRDAKIVTLYKNKGERREMQGTTVWQNYGNSFICI
ncbi:uncharacterized protein LOC143020093 [Oratosquilla oratoria]|uniref:uncharacterized protein LOC143020093 n=1 Tax=Oratosquilla oratoria TaxID=337810 RepID=UPI003F772A1C